MITREDFPANRAFPLERKRALQALFVGPTKPARRLGRKLRITIAGTGAVVVLGGGGALAYSAISANSVSDETSARCYTVAQYSAKGDDFPGTSIAAAGTADAPGRVTSAVDVCASLWRSGFLQPGVPTPVRNPDQASYPVPALVGCVMADGQAAVFPGTTATCNALGLVAVASRPASS
jgi:hypothetical protein